MNISIIDDEKILADKTCKKLEKHWYWVNVFHSCKDFYSGYMLDSDLYIIDLWLWDWVGFDIIKWLRNEKKSTSPIIIMSAYADSEKKVYGLDLWADDYMTKPVVPEELLARVKAHLRRNNNIGENFHILKYENISFDTENHILKVGSKKIELTKKEIQLVHFFLTHPGKLIPKNKIIYSVWNSSDFSSVSDNTINVTVSKIRKKLGRRFKLKTKVNEGYILEI